MSYTYGKASGPAKVAGKVVQPKRAYIFLEGEDRLNFIALSTLAGEGQNRFGLNFIRTVLAEQIKEAKGQMKDRFQPEFDRIKAEIRKADSEEAKAKSSK